MKTKILALSVLCSLVMNIIGQTPNFNYVKQIGGSDNDLAYSIEIDSDQNLYLTGFYRNTVDFDPDTGVTNLTSNGLEDIFIQKLDSSGKLLWVKTIQGVSSGSGTGFDLTVDSNNDIIITGQYGGTIDFDPGPGVYNLTSISSAKDNFILKIDSAGSFIWAKSIGSTSSVYGWSIDTDTDNNIYITGGFKGSADFDPGTASFNMTSVTNSEDIYVMKLSTSGDFIWAKQMRSTSNNYAHSINIDDNDNVYIGGHFRGSVDFDPSPSINTVFSNGNEDVFIQKLDTAGNLIWIKNIGGPSDDQCNDLKSDNSGNIIFTGFFRDIADFDPGTGTFNLSCTGQGNGLNLHDAFVCKLDPLGDLIWAKGFGSNNVDIGRSVMVDSNDNIYSIGNYRDTIDLDPNTGIDTAISLGSDDIFIQKLSPSGNYLWGITYGGIGIEDGRDIIVGNDNAIYLTGTFEDTVDFNHDSLLVDSLISNGTYDFFILKLNQLNPTTSINKFDKSHLSIEVYPNPSSGYVTVSIAESSRTMDLKFKLCDITGKVVLSEQLSKSLTFLDLSNLKSGLYLYQIFNGNNVNFGKIVVE